MIYGDGKEASSGAENVTAGEQINGQSWNESKGIWRVREANPRQKMKLLND